MKSLLFCMLLLTAHVIVRAQVSQQIWADVLIQKKVTDRVSWMVNGGPRFMSGWGFNIGYVTSAVIYKPVNHVSLLGGLAYFFTTAPPGGHNSHELRPWQGVRLDFKLAPWISVQNYSRLEEREVVYETHNDFSLRLRNMIGANFFVYRSKKSASTLYLPIFYETFEDVNKSWRVNRDRAYVGGGCSFAKNRIELYYIPQRGRADVNEDMELKDNIYRARWLIDL